MIRQLPKLSLPSFMASRQGADTQSVSEASDVKVYDLITASTALNSEGNTMQLQLSQKDSQTMDAGRELHGRIVLNTEQLPDQQALQFGFVFSQDQESGKYDGLMVTTQVDHASQSQTFEHADITTSSKPDIFTQTSFMEDSLNDWVILAEESFVVCEDVGRCEFSVAFKRAFKTADEENDIAIEEGEEQRFSMMGFYAAENLEDGQRTHIGQSHNLYAFMGAGYGAAATSALLLASAALTLAAF